MKELALRSGKGFELSPMNGDLEDLDNEMIIS
jgi:hypothetical protein